MKHVTRFMLPALLGLTLMPAGAGQQAAVSSAPDAAITPVRPRTQKQERQLADKIPVSDMQLKQLAALFNDLPWNSEEAIKDFHVILLNAPRPADEKDARIYEQVQRLNRIIKAPVTDAVVYEKAPLTEGMAFKAGNRSFIVFSSEEFNNRPQAMQEREQDTMESHELAHHRLGHVTNLLAGFAESAHALGALKQYVTLLSEKMDKNSPASHHIDSLGQKLDEIADQMVGMATILPQLQETMPSNPKFKPLFKGQGPDAETLIGMMRTLQRYSIRQESAADRYALKATHDGEAAAQHLTDFAMTDMATEIFVRALAESLPDISAHTVNSDARAACLREACMQKAAAEINAITPEKALLWADQNLKAYDEFGMLDHPFYATRIAEFRYYQEHDRKRQDGTAR